MAFLIICFVAVMAWSLAAAKKNNEEASRLFDELKEMIERGETNECAITDAFANLILINLGLAVEVIKLASENESNASGTIKEMYLTSAHRIALCRPACYYCLM